MADVFVSYSRQDAAFVRELLAFLRGDGRDVWVDWEDIPPASKWEEDIDDSIDDADSFLFVASPGSLASEYCAGELGHAVERGKRIVPLAIDDANPEEAPETLRQLNWIWCREMDDRDDAYAKLITALDTDLEWAKAHTRLLKRAVEWGERGDGSLLMRGKDLSEAERALAENAGSDPRPTEVQERYLHASRRSANRRQRALLSGVSVAFAVAVGLAILALLQRNTAITQRNSARSLALAGAADFQRSRHLDVALLLGLEANRYGHGPQARSSMISSLETLQQTGARAILRTDAPVDSVAFSPDGTKLAAGQQNGDIRLWDLRTHRQLGPPLRAETASLTNVTPGAAVTSVALDRGGTLLASGHQNLDVRLWDLRKRRPIGDPMSISGDSAGNANGVSAVSFSRDGSRVAGADAAKAVLWDVATHASHGEPLLLGSQDEALRASFSPDGGTLAQLLSGSVDLWNVRYDAIAGSTKLPDNGIDTGGVSAANPDSGGAQYVAVSRGGRMVAGSDGGLVKLWNVRAPRRPTTVQPGHAGNVQAIAFAPDGRMLATGGDDDTVRLSAVPSSAGAARAPPGPTMAVGFRPGGRMLAGGGAPTGAGAWVSGAPSPVDVDVGGVAHVAFSPDGTLGIVTSGSRKIARVWTVATGHAVSPPLGAEPNSVAAFGPGGTRVVTGGYTGQAWLWKVGSGERPLLLDGRSERDGAIQSVAYSPKDEYVVTGAEHGRARLWAAATGKPVGLFDAHRGTVESVAFSADGRYLVTGYDDGTARVWTASDRRQVGEPLRVAPSGYGVVTVAFAPDGQTLATGTDREQVQLWDVASHQPLCETLTGDTVAISPDGQSLAVGSVQVEPRTRPPRLWSHILWPDIDALRTVVCSVAWTNLTKAEWAVYAPRITPHATCGSG